MRDMTDEIGTITPKTAQRRVIHVDCDNFFAACEQLFRPDLRARAVAQHVDRAVAKLVAQGSLTAEISVFINTSRYGIDFYHNSHTMRLERPSDFLPDFSRAAQSCLTHIYRPHRRYARSGVFMGAIDPPDRYQFDLFHTDDPRAQRMNEAVQGLRRRWGRQVIGICRGVGDSDWITESKYRSPRYTTNWAELPLVH